MNDQILDRSGHRPSIAIYAIFLFRRFQLRDRVFSLIAIYTIMLFCDCNLRDRVILPGPRFKPRAKQYNFFIGPGFNSLARLPVSEQCD